MTRQYSLWQSKTPVGFKYTARYCNYYRGNGVPAFKYFFNTDSLFIEIAVESYE